jgi:hypothetical protein
MASRLCGAWTGNPQSGWRLDFTHSNQRLFPERGCGNSVELTADGGQNENAQANGKFG